MKALTIRQPWASLIAVGAKTIYTSERSTEYRGPLVIHAGLKWVRGAFGEYRCEPWWDAEDVRHVDECECGDGIAPACARRSLSRPVLTLGGEWFMDLPLGAVVASCVLADVVPIVAEDQSLAEVTSYAWIDSEFPDVVRLEFWERDHAGRLAKKYHELRRESAFGDFSPGRYAWILEDVKPTTERCPWCWGALLPGPGALISGIDGKRCPACKGESVCPPVPAHGHPGLWEWTPEAVSA